MWIVCIAFRIKIWSFLRFYDNLFSKYLLCFISAEYTIRLVKTRNDRSVNCFMLIFLFCFQVYSFRLLFSFLDFLDASDTSLAFAVFGTSQTRNFPIAVFNVSKGKTRDEYLLCYSGMLFCYVILFSFFFSI